MSEQLAFDMAEVGLDVPQGYKRTEVGVIPEDWEVEELQQLCRSPITYGIVQCGAHVQDGVPYIRVSDMNSDKLNIDEMLRTDPKIAASFARSKVEEGDIVYALRGKLGEVRIVDSVVAGANLTQGTARISPNKGIYNNYLLWTMRSPQSVRQALKEAKGSTFVEITLADLKRIEIPVPDRTEQTAIATALSDVDALINELEQLVAKKQAIKTATMQQLLTGHTRLPQFALREDGSPKGYKSSELGEIPEDWEVKQLSDLADIRSGGTPSTTDARYWGGDIYWCTPTDVTALKGQKYLNSTARTITMLGVLSSAAELLPVGTIVMTSRATIGECAITQIVSSTNQGFKNFICFKTTDNHFLFYLLNTLRDRFIGLCSGSTFLEISTTQIRAIPVFVPFSEEQTAIATILTDMDSDISSLQQRLSKTRQIKQGMMQELLTGKTRLKT